MDRPHRLNSSTIKLKLDADGEEVTMYITIVYSEDQKPVEVFVNCKNPIFAEHMNVFTILVSRLLQAGTPMGEIQGDLSGVSSPITSHHAKTGEFKSLYARIGKILEEHATG